MKIVFLFCFALLFFLSLSSYGNSKENIGKKGGWHKKKHYLGREKMPISQKIQLYVFLILKRAQSPSRNSPIKVDEKSNPNSLTTHI